MDVRNFTLKVNFLHFHDYMGNACIRFHSNSHALGGTFL